MYEDFHVTDRWSGEDLHCRWKGTIVAIATRHADAVDVRFDVNGRPMWIAMPNEAWVAQKKRTGKVSGSENAAGQFAQTMQTQMLYVLPVMIVLIAYRVSAAVALYWITSNLVTIGQELYTRNKMKNGKIV